MTHRLPATLAALAFAAPALAQSDDAELAKQLANPVASLVSAPFQYNYDSGFGEDGDGERSYINFQPVIPFSIGEDWNVISRTILPLVWNDGVIPGEDHQFGLGATTQSFFFSPKQPGGLTWGVGPAFLIPTATDHIATNQWGAGLTGVALRQSGPWTVGALANHIWSVTGDDDDGDISSTFLQPFVNYTTPTATSFFVNTETTYDWESEQWSVPINAGVNQLVTIGQQRVQFGVGARYWLESPDAGPDGWGARAGGTFLFPR
jgi:hypothetical protein